jgi:hypothetical protein
MPGYSGGTAAADIARLRLFVAESGTVTYTDSSLRAIVANYPLPDSAGEWPYLTSGSVNTAWTGTFDLAAAAAEIWDNKGAAIAAQFDFTADGATYHKSQQVTQYEKNARKWRSRRAPGSYTAVVYPTESADLAWIANWNDPYA